MTIRFQTGEFSFIAFSSEMCARYALLNDMRFTCCYSFSLSFKENKHFEITETRLVKVKWIIQFMKALN